MKPQNTSELSKIGTRRGKKIPPQNIAYFGQVLSLKKMNWILPCVSTTYMLFCQEQAGGKKSSQAHNPNGVYFRNALLIQAHKKKRRIYGGKFWYRKKLQIE